VAGDAVRGESSAVPGKEGPVVSLTTAVSLTKGKGAPRVRGRCAVRRSCGGRDAMRENQK